MYDYTVYRSATGEVVDAGECDEIEKEMLAEEYHGSMLFEIDFRNLEPDASSLPIEEPDWDEPDWLNIPCVCGSFSCDGTCETATTKRKEAAEYRAYMEAHPEELPF